MPPDCRISPRSPVPAAALIVVLGGLMLAWPTAAQADPGAGSSKVKRSGWWGPLRLGSSPAPVLLRPSAPKRAVHKVPVAVPVAAPVVAPVAAPVAAPVPTPAVASTSGDPLAWPAFSPLGVPPRGGRLGPVLAQARPRRAAARPAPRRAMKGKAAGQPCKVDRECAVRTICHLKRKVCVKVRRNINAVLYWKRFGRKGWEIAGPVVPFYLHFWSPQKSTRVVIPGFPVYVGVKNKKTGTHHRTVMGLFHHTKYKDGWRFNIYPFLLFAGKRGKRSWGGSILPIPFFYYNTPKTKRWMAFPFAGGMRSKEKSFTWALPFNFYWRKKSSRHFLFFPLAYGRSDPKKKRVDAAVFPLFYYGKFGAHRERFVSPLFIGGRDRREGWKYFFLTAPPMFFSRDKDHEIDLVVPFYFRYKNKRRGSTLTIVPPVGVLSDRRQINAAVFPLFYYFKDRRSGAYTALFFPLFYRHRTDEGDHLTVVGPAFGEKRKDGWAGGLAPLLFMGRKGPKTHGVLFPIFWHFADKQKGTTSTVAGPLYVTTQKKGWSFGLLPLLFFKSTPKASHQVIFPIFWRMQNHVTKSSTTVLAPAYWWRNRSGSGHGVAPIYDYRRWYTPQGYVASSLMIFPLLYHLNTPKQRAIFTPLGGYVESYITKRKTGVFGPVFWDKSPSHLTAGVFPIYGFHRNTKKKSETHVFLPFNVYHRSPGHRSLVIFPLLWYFKRPTERAVTVFPLFFHLRQKKGWSADVLFPIFWNLAKGNRRTTVFAPVYYHREEKGRKHIGVFPLFHYYGDKKKTYAHFLPLFFHYKNKATGTRATIFGPVYSVRHKEQRHNGALLAYWGRRGTKTYAVGFPLYWSFGDTAKRKKTSFFGPFFWHRRGDTTGGGLFPLLWVQRNKHGRRQVTIFPLFHYEKRSSRLNVWTPLFGFGWDKAKNKRYGYAGPVYWENSPKRSAQVVFPLFWRFNNKKTKTTTTLAIPLYFGRKTPETRLDVAFPLVWHYKTVTSRALFILPLLYDQVNYHESHTTALIPFFYRHRVHHKKETTALFLPACYLKTSPGKTDFVFFPLFWHFGEKEKHTTVAFPLWWDFKKPGKRTTVLFPLFWRFAKGDVTKTFVLPNLYIKQNKTLGTWQFHFFPIIEVSKKRPGDIKWNVLGGLFGYERIGRNRSFRLFWFRIRLKPLAVTPGAPSTAPARRASFSEFYPL